MSRYRDEFGEDVEEGDTILSFATRTGMVKIGKAYYGPSTLRMVIMSANYGGHSKSSEVGSFFIILRKADGRVPEKIGAYVNG